MMEIGVHEVKTHLSSLLKRVERGESITITNRGKPVALLSRPPQTFPVAEEMIRRMRVLAQEAPLAPSLEILIAWKNEGQR